MYSDIINVFLNSIRSLRYYVDSVERKMETRLVGPDEYDNTEDMALLMRFVMKAKKNGINLSDTKLRDMIASKARIEIPSDVSDEVLDESVNLSIEIFNVLNSLIREKVIDGKTTYEYMGVPKKIKEKYREIEMQENQADILYSGSLMLLVTYFENLVSGVLKKDFLKHPERISLDEKSISYKMLTEFENVRDIREYLIDQEVTNKMYDSFFNWKSFFEKKVKLNLDYWNDNFDNIQEIIARRNIFVHNNGVVNSIYLNLLNNKDDGIHIGDTIEINREYIDTAINILEYAGISLVVEIWIKEYACIENEVKNITNFIFEEYLLSERWDIARHLYQICLKNKKLLDADKILCQINMWQCYKWIGEYDKIKNDVISIDVSALKPKYNLGILVLQEKYEEFFDCFDKQNEIGEDELKEWPLFKELRKSTEYKERFTDMLDDIDKSRESLN